MHEPMGVILIQTATHGKAVLFLNLLFFLEVLFTSIRRMTLFKTLRLFNEKQLHINSVKKRESFAYIF